MHLFNSFGMYFTVERIVFSSTIASLLFSYVGSYGLVKLPLAKETAPRNRLVNILYFLSF